jgi:hypothetical protein
MAVGVGHAGCGGNGILQDHPCGQAPGRLEAICTFEGTGTIEALMVGRGHHRLQLPAWRTVEWNASRAWPGVSK